MSEDFKYNFSDAKDFLTSFDELNSFIFQVFDDNSDRKDPKLSTWFPANVPGAKPRERLKRYNEQGAGVFFMVNQGDRRDNKGVQKIRAVFADFDHMAPDPLFNCPLKPHIIVQSSEHGYHAYWLVEGFPKDDFSRVQKAIAAYFGSDSSVHDLARVMRLPGFYHNKIDKKTGEVKPFLTKVLRKETGLEKYSLEDVEAFFCVKNTGKKEKKPASTLPHSFDPGEQHDNLVRLSASLKKNYGFSESELKTVLAAVAASRGHREPDEKEIDSIVGWTGEKVESGLKLLNQSTIAQAMAEAHGHRLKYIFETKTFIFWNGKYWEWDDSGNEVMRTCQNTVVKAVDAYGFEKEKQAVESKNRYLSKTNLDAIIRLYGHDPNVSLTLNYLDADPYLLNVSNGMVDLRTGRIYDHNPQKYCTRMINLSYDPGAKCPKWEEFLKDIQPKESYRKYLKTVEGYCTTGVTTEQLFWIYYGSGGNGKSIFMNTLKGVRGGYSIASNAETFAVKRYDNGGPNPGLRELKGYRDVQVNETSKGFEFDGPVIKTFVDAETPIKVRGLYEKPVEYKPCGKLRFVTNAKPKMKVDGGFLRRIKFIGFGVKIPKEKRNKNLYAELVEEWPGILTWLVEGAVDYFREGIPEVEEVDKDTLDYLDESDQIRLFLKECTVQKEGAQVTPTELYQLYEEWVDYSSEGKYKASRRTFKIKMEDQGFIQGRSYKTRYWKDLGALDDSELPFREEDF